MIESTTVHGMLDVAAERFPDTMLFFPSAKDSISLAALAEDSRRLACGLRSRGVAPGDPVGIVLPSCRDFVVAFFAALRAGAAPSPLALPQAFRSADRFFERVDAILRSAGIRVLVGRHASLAGEAGAGPRGVTLLDPEELRTGAADERLPIVAPHHLALVQFTSGSTSEPKGVALSHDNVLAGLNAVIGGISLDSADVNGQWIPLYHDMGLIGMLSGIAAGVTQHIWSPRAFFRDPAAWIHGFASVGATIYAGPSFSYQALLSSITDEDLARLDLSRWRVAFNGAEPIDAGVLEAFVDRFRLAKLSSSTMFPVYGLAEITLAATFPKAGERPELVWIDRRALHDHNRVESRDRADPGATGVVCVGAVVAGHELAIVDEYGVPLADDQIGQIELRGPAIMRGYYRDPQASAEAFREGWLRTGDLGFVRGGNLFVTGRAKEMIIVRGMNIYPMDVEAMVRQRLGPLASAGCIAFSAGEIGDERIVVLLEVRSTDRDVLLAALDEHRDDLVSRLGVDVVDIVLVKPQTIERTTSGKQQRLTMRGYFLAGDLSGSIIGESATRAKVRT